MQELCDRLVILLEVTIGSGDGVPRTVVATGEWTRRFASDVRSPFLVLPALSCRTSVRPNHMTMELIRVPVQNCGLHFVNREFLHFAVDSPLCLPTLAVPSLAECSRIAAVFAR